MSGASLRKLRSQWLDKNDEQDGTASPSSSAEGAPGDARDMSKNDWETILGSPSRDPSPSKWPCCQQEHQADLETQHVSNTSFIARKPCLPLRKCRGCEHAPRTFSSSRSGGIQVIETGSSRLLSDKVLLLVRSVGLAGLGISAGLSFASRATTPTPGLVTELFPWLHITYMIVLPFLVSGSLQVWGGSKERSTEESFSVTTPIWTAFGIISHLLGTFSLTELVRLVMLHSVRSLRPTETAASAALYSLTSVFAYQRYVMALIAVAEILFVAAPQRVCCLLVVFLFAISWEILMYFNRTSDRTAGEKLAVATGSVAIAELFSGLFIFVDRMLSSDERNLGTVTKTREDTEDQEVAI